MSVQDVVRKLGQWSITLREGAPPGLVDSLAFFGRVAIVPGRVNPVELGDDLLGMARYVGVLRTVEVDDAPTLSGPGMNVWLGDEDGKGDVIESPGVVLTGATFAEAVRALLPAGGAVTEGAIHTGIAGTITNTFSYVTPRAALDYLCDTMAPDQATYRVNGDGTLDAGPADVLYRSTPTCLIVRREAAGYDVGLKALRGELASTRDASDYATRVVLVAAALAGGTADAPVVPYKDPHGNPVRWTKVVDEQDDTLVANAPARAQSALAKANLIRRSVRLSVDDFDVAGDFSAGDVVWVYDPDAGLYDPANEVSFRGRLIHPMAVRTLSLSWPVTQGYTVAYRDGDGAWTDLTPWVAWESEGGGEVEVADAGSASLTGGSIGSQVSGSGGGLGDAAVPNVPVFGAFTTASYTADDGLPRASVRVTWTQPTNTDGSTIVDGDRYEIRYRVSGTSDWRTTFVAFDQTAATIADLPPNTGYDWSIRAVDYATPTNYGAWSATTTFTTSQDTIAPPDPAPASVAASQLAVQITHTLGQASGGTWNLPLDLDHLEVHVGTTSSFTVVPSGAGSTLAGTLKATRVELAGSIPVVCTFAVDRFVPAGQTAYVRVVAVDRAGNRSGASAAASATAQLVDSAHISSLTASKIDAGTITTAVVIGGSATFAGSLQAATGTFAGSLQAATGTFTGQLSGATGSFTGTVSTGASGRRVTLNPLGQIDLVGSSGNTGDISVNSVGEIALSAGGGSVRVGGAQCTVSTALSCSSLSTGSLSCSSLSTTTGGASITGNLTANGGTWSGVVTVGSAGNQLSLQGSTVLFGNIPFTGATGVAANFNGRYLQGVSSTRASKVGIADADVTAADALRLRPVSFYARDEVERNGGTDGLTRHFGFIAEEVDAVPALRSLVVRGGDGAPIGLGYDRVPVLHQVVLVDHEARLTALAERLAALESA